MARFVSEYEKEGIKIKRLTVQNEPAAVQTWDSCIYSGAEEAEFAVNYLRPALNEAGFYGRVCGILPLCNRQSDKPCRNVCT